MFIIIISGITGKKGVLRGQKILFFCPFHPLNRLIFLSKKNILGIWRNFGHFRGTMIRLMPWPAI
jgi:hypothetical protein